VRSAARFFLVLAYANGCADARSAAEQSQPAKVLSKLGCRCPLSLSACWDTASRLALVGRWSLA